MQKICLGFDTPTDFSPTGLQEIIQKACKLSTGRHKGISAVDFKFLKKMRIKAIKGFEDTYAVSDDGRVFNIRSGRELKQKDNKGYFEVTLSSRSGRKSYRVHRLVYQAFVRVLDNNLVIDHIDGNRKNNHQDNLRQIHTRDNTNRAKSHPYGMGVHLLKNRNKYTATIAINGNSYYLGVYSRCEDAANAYANALMDWKEKGNLPRYNYIRRTKK